MLPSRAIVRKYLNTLISIGILLPVIILYIDYDMLIKHIIIYILGICYYMCGGL